MDPFATLEELEARLEWTLDDGERRIAQGALESLSDDARFYGRAWLNAQSAPRQVKNLVLKAASRFMRNPDGYTTSRAGDETLAWTDRGENSGEAEFTEREIKALKAMAGQGGIVSVPTYAWNSRKSSGPVYVPVSGYPGEKAFPYFASEDEF